MESLPRRSRSRANSNTEVSLKSMIEKWNKNRKETMDLQQKTDEIRKELLDARKRLASMRETWETEKKRTQQDITAANRNIQASEAEVQERESETLRLRAETTERSARNAEYRALFESRQNALNKRAEQVRRKEEAPMARLENFFQLRAEVKGQLELHLRKLEVLLTEERDRHDQSMAGLKKRLQEAEESSARETKKWNEMVLRKEREQKVRDYKTLCAEILAVSQAKTRINAISQEVNDGTGEIERLEEEIDRLLSQIENKKNSSENSRESSIDRTSTTV